MNLKIKEKVRPWVPFTGLWTIWRLIDKSSQSILDVGCGKGEPMRFINRQKRFFTVGADIFKPYLDMCRTQGIHDNYVQCDVNALPFKDGSFDLVFCSEVLEHLTKEEGLKLIANFEKIARRQVILTTPLHSFKQEAYDENAFQEHKCIWEIDEFKRLNYRVILMGLRGTHDYPSFLQFPIWGLASPFTHFMPKLAGQMVCVKNIVTR